MTLHHLRVFAMVCQYKTMHAAAEKLNLSQPAISKIIADLEKYYDIQLFERINHRLYVTPMGETVHGYAMQILEMVQNMEDEINIQGKHKHIRIGASVSVGTCLLPPIIQKLQQNQITYEVTIHNTSKIEQMVNEYMLDLALVEGQVDNPNLIAKPVREDELVLVVRAAHPLACKRQVVYADLEQYPFITREDGSSRRNQLELHLQQEGVRIMTNYSCSSVEAIKQALLYTDGISVLSEMMIGQEIRKGVLTILPLANMQFKRSIRLIYHKNKYISEAMKAFLAALEDKVEQCADNTTS
ncbi:MAG: LysR family transcriptional regulator [Butyricicoccus pullicaecorum]|nr:LysR family transcriptional regulator [Butyricicoccus pullicaecorum]